MNIIFILRKLTSKETEFISKNYPPASSQIFFDPSFLTDTVFSEYKKEIIPQLLNENISERWIECFVETNQFGHSSFKGKKVIDWLSFGKNTMWYYLRPLIFLAYKSQLLSSDNILSGYNKLDSPKDARIYVFGNASDAKCFIPHSVPIIEFTGKHRPDLFKEKIRIFNFIILFCIRTFIGFFQLPILLLNRKNNILFEDPKKSQKIVDLKTMKTITGDSYVEYLKQKASHNKDFLLLSELFIPNVKKEPLPLRAEFIFSRYFFKTIYYEIFIILALINPFNLVRLFRFSSRLKKFYFLYEKSLSNPKQQIILDTVRSKHRLTIICLLREFSAQLFLSIASPATIGGDHEHELKNKPILTIAQKRRIKTFGIQHGLIHPLHFHYMFTNLDMKYNPVPDVTIVWGNHWKNILMKHSAFTEDNLVILGQIRTDCIPLVKKLSKNDVIPGLKNETPLILFATQPFRDGESHLQREIMNDFFLLVNDFPGVEFIIKPHPYEMDLSIYTSRIPFVKYDNLQIISDDIYKLLAVSNIVLVYSSTVGTETVYFKKNLIVLDYHNNDIMNYANKEVAYRASKYDELKETVANILNGKLKTDEDAMKKFIENNVYRIDGKTCDRHIAFIRSLG